MSGTGTQAAAAGTAGAGAGCGCSFFGCCAGCLGALFLALAGTVGLTVAGWYYLPGYIEQRMAEAQQAQAADTSGLFSAAAAAPPEGATRLTDKVGAFARQLGADGPVDVTLTVTDAELNAWLAARLAAQDTPLPVERFAVALGDGTVHAALRARGKDLANLIPPGPAVDYVRGVLARTDLVDVDVVARAAAEGGQARLSVESLRVGPLAVPALLANAFLDRVAEAGALPLGGATLADLKIEPGRLTVRGVRGTAAAR